MPYKLSTAPWHQTPPPQARPSASFHIFCTDLRASIGDETQKAVSEPDVTAADPPDVIIPFWYTKPPEELEKQYYYHGLSFRPQDDGTVAIRKPGPKLVFRTSKDVWRIPTDQEFGHPRKMWLVDVPEDHVLSQNAGVWEHIRSEVRGPLALQQTRVRR